MRRNHCVRCDLDDYPLGYWKRSIRWLDELKKANPNFKCTVFAVPGAMLERHWKPLVRRKEWIHVGWHGFLHGHLECTLEIDYGRLFDLFADDRFSPVFKGGWCSVGKNCIEAVRDRGWILAMRTEEELLGIEGVKVVFKKTRKVWFRQIHTHRGWHRRLKLPWDVPNYTDWVRNRDFKFTEDFAC